jgi:hypothetical protein
METKRDAPLLDNVEGSLFVEAAEVTSTVEALTDDPPRLATSNRSFDWVIIVLERYQEQPSLLDPHLEAIVGPLMRAVRRRTTEGPSEEMAELMRVVYVLCKVRGYKTVGTSPRRNHTRSSVQISPSLARAQGPHRVVRLRGVCVCVRRRFPTRSSILPACRG